MKRKFETAISMDKPLSGDIPSKGVICGVYAMYIGTSFYTGRSVDIMRRIGQYQYEINKLFLLYGSDSSDTIPDYHYLINVFNRLTNHPEITTLNFSIFEICKPEDIIQCEQKWLYESSCFPECLNVGFEARPCSGDTKIKNILANAGQSNQKV